MRISESKFVIVEIRQRCIRVFCRNSDLLREGTLDSFFLNLAVIEIVVS